MVLCRGCGGVCLGVGVCCGVNILRDGVGSRVCVRVCSSVGGCLLLRLLGMYHDNFILSPKGFGVGDYLNYIKYRGLLKTYITLVNHL